MDSVAESNQETATAACFDDQVRRQPDVANVGPLIYSPLFSVYYSSKFQRTRKLDLLLANQLSEYH